MRVHNEPLSVVAVRVHSPATKAVLVLERRLAFSRLPVNRVLFEVGVNGAAYRRIEVGGAEAFE